MNTLRKIYNRKDSSGWTLKSAKDDLTNNEQEFLTVHYKPFDKRHTVFTGTSSGFMGRPREKESALMAKPNVALLSVRNSRRGNVNCFFVADTLVDKDGISPFDNVKFFPLYDYPKKENGQEVYIDGRERTPNLNEEIVYEISEELGLEYTYEKEDLPGTFAPVDLLDYIYAVLHSSTYRKTYKEFLKIDFPRVPYPDDQEKFWLLVKLGGELRKIHLLESPVVENFITGYPVDGDNLVTRKITKNSLGFEVTNEAEGTGKVWINDSQYFDNVPEVAWGFYIGGYQPAQKWLKDRKDRRLSFEDLLHYQKIIVALIETNKLMEEIDKINLVNESN